MSKIPNPDQEKLKRLEAELRELRKELKESREIIRRERERNQQLNSDKSRSSGNCYQSPEIPKLKRWIELLQHDFRVLLESRRWKLGNAIISAARGGFVRKRNPGSLVHAEEVFAEFETWKQKSSLRSNLAPGPVRKMPVSKLMEQLEKDISALSESTRYRVGNSLIRMPGLVLLRKKPRLAMDHMMELFSDYHAAVEKRGIVPPEMMVELVENLRDVFESFLDSSRWKLGCRLVSSLEAVFPSRRKEPGSENILRLFADFEKGKYSIPGLKARRITIEDDSSTDDYS